jgi:hypothetical protein
MACSATLPKATLNYIHKSLHLGSPTVLCNNSSDRPSISLFTAPIEKGHLESRMPLLDLVPEEARTWDPSCVDDDQWGPWLIPKTLVFIDDRMACCTLTTELINKFPERLRGCEARELICEYHSTMSAQALERNLLALREGICRIMVCTDAVGMGLDVPDIERVVQWRVPQWMTLASWWQRAGRAARDPEFSGVAIIYYEPSLIVPEDSPFCGRAENPAHLESVFGSIHADDDAANEVQDSAGDIDRQGKGKRRKGELPCEGQLLWYLNTKGCLREVAMHYLGAESEPRPAFGDAESGAPCCCRCYKASQVDPDLFEGIPVRKCTPFAGISDELEQATQTAPEDDVAFHDQEERPDSQDLQKAPGNRKSYARNRLAVRLSLEIWRHRVLGTHARFDRKLQPKHILSDSAISKLEAKCFDIATGADVVSAISGPKRNIVKHTRISACTDVLAKLIAHVVKTSDPPEPPHRARSGPHLPGPAKPMYSDQDIQTAENTTVAHMMKDANLELRNLDLTVANAKETARLQRASTYELRRLVFGGSQMSVISQTESVGNSVISKTYSQALSDTQRTDRDAMPPPPIPLKRGRGRPRGSKNKPKSQHSRPPSEASISSGDGTVTPGSSRPLPKRRLLPQDPDSDDQSDIQPREETPVIQPREETPVVQPREATPFKRGRGRPKGSRNKPKTQDASPLTPGGPSPAPALPDPPPLGIAASPDAVLPAASPDAVLPAASPGAVLPAASSASATALKRKRGRPKGSKNKPKAQSPPPPPQ